MITDNYGKCHTNRYKYVLESRSEFRFSVCRRWSYVVPQTFILSNVFTRYTFKFICGRFSRMGGAFGPAPGDKSVNTALSSPNSNRSTARVTKTRTTPLNGCNDNGKKKINNSYNHVQRDRFTEKKKKNETTTSGKMKRNEHARSESKHPARSCWKVWYHTCTHTHTHITILPVVLIGRVDGERGRENRWFYLSRTRLRRGSPRGKLLNSDRVSVRFERRFENAELKPDANGCVIRTVRDSGNTSAMCGHGGALSLQRCSVYNIARDAWRHKTTLLVTTSFRRVLILAASSPAFFPDAPNAVMCCYYCFEMAPPPGWTHKRLSGAGGRSDRLGGRLNIFASHLRYSYRSVARQMFSNEKGGRKYNSEHRGADNFDLKNNP